MASKFTGKLNTHMAPRNVGLLDDSEQAKALYAQWYAEDLENLNLLCAHFGIANGPHQYVSLSLELARLLVPCFQVKAKEGRPKKWGDYELGKLAVELERIVATGATIDAAAKILAGKRPWSTFLESWGTGNNHFGAAPADALITAYKSAKKKKFTRVARDAFKFHEMTSTIPKWDDEVLALKGNN